MVEFDPAAAPGSVITGRRKMLVLDLAEQLLLGRRVDVGTQKFWSEQPREAANHWLEATEHHSAAGALDEVRIFAGGAKVWAKGPQFDLTNLLGLAEDVGYAEPLWHYRAPRDVRTFIETTAKTRDAPEEVSGTLHDPVADCVYQVQQVWSHWQQQ
jgi:hypothetical protein